MYTLERTTILPTTIDEAWNFFADPRNLDYITPEEMEFQVKTKLKAGEFYPGMLIEYVVRPFIGIPFRWVSEIRNVEEKKHFHDVQLIGPYAMWLHRHEFSLVQGGVEMKDIVEYQMPYGWFGRLLHKLVIRKKLEYIFDYRTRKIQFLFQRARRV
jgi:ligand-binding SRPBCC domain-containing protein